jgi:hypothetical protein
MHAWRSMTCARDVCVLGLTLSAAACGGSDAEPAQQTGVLDGATIVGGAMAPDASSPAGFDASSGPGPTVPPAVTDAASSLGGTDAGRAEAGVGAGSDAGPNNRDAGRGPIEAGSAGGDTGATLERFSFFVTSLNAMRMLSGNRNGFGGDLRHGETGEGAGLRGADKICTEAAELSMPGAAAKQWRAYLSTTTVAARTRIGEGPWYDRKGRLIAQNWAGLMSERPQGAPADIRDDLPNELGDPNRAGSAEGGRDDNHDVITATNAAGEYDGSNSCADWTSTTATLPGGGGAMGLAGPRIGHSWPAGSGQHWAAAHNTAGCVPSVNLVQGGAGVANGIGNLGGYGAIYCFALTP